MSGEVETRARELGWVPQEEFRGDVSKWVDADTFVKRGEQMLPLLRKHNKDLEQQVQTLNGKLQTVESLFAETQESIKALQEFHTADTKRQVENAKKELKAQLVAAKEAGDHSLEVEIQDQLDDIRVAEKAVAATPPAPAPAPAAQKEDPVWTAWKAEKAPWWQTDPRKTALLVAEAQQLRAENDPATGAAFLDKALARMEEFLGEPARPQKVEGAGGGGGGGGGGGKKHTYDGLPVDAKTACDNFEKKLVGPGKAFKSAAEWRNHYVTQYYAGE